MSLRMPRVQVRMAPIFRMEPRPRLSGGSREQDVEGRAATRLAFHGDCSLMLQNDAPRDGQAQAGAVGLGGEEGFEQPRQVSRRYAGSVVLHGYPELGPARGVSPPGGPGVGRDEVRGD